MEERPKVTKGHRMLQFQFPSHIVRFGRVETENDGGSAQVRVRDSGRNGCIVDGS